MGHKLRGKPPFKDSPYQDVWFQGRAIIRGGRECQFRYEAIEKYLKRFKRPISVIDIGANMGYFSLRLMEVFQGTFVMVEGHEKNARNLLKICKLNDNPQAIVLQRKLCLEDLKALSEVEHFDVVIALSIIHHFEEPYQEVFEVLSRLGSCLIFEPPCMDEKTINQERIVAEPLDLSTVKKKLLARTTNGSLGEKKFYRDTYAIQCEQSKLVKKTYFSAPHDLPSFPKITADEHQRKIFLPRQQKEMDWPEGISFNTFLALNGIYPTKNRIFHLMNDLPLKDHDRIQPWDLTLMGACLKHLPRSFTSDGIHAPEASYTYGMLRKHVSDYLSD